jgi:hypothetical protein
MAQEFNKFVFPDEQGANEVEIEKDPSDELEIEIENDTPPLDRNRKPIPEEKIKELEETDLEELQKDSQKALKEMKKVWHQERREKEAALREQQEAIHLAKKALEENKKLKERLHSGETAFVDTVKHSALQELEAAKVAFKAAYESGDADKLLEAQERMTNAKIKADKAENYQPKLEKALQYPEDDVQIQQPQVNVPDKKALKWQKKNRWFGKDEEMTSLALGLHEKLVRNGVPAGSNKYYDSIDETMRKRFPEKFQKETEEVEVPEADEPVQVQKPKASTVVAPATRSTSPKKIRMSKTQVLLAKKLGLTPEQYARELTKLES